MASPEIALLLELVLDLKKDQGELKEISIMNAAVLLEHERRSLASEKRIETLEKRDQMLNGFVKISVGTLAVAASILGIVTAIRHLL